MKWRRPAAVVLRQLYLMRGSISRLFPLFAWVAIDILLWGFITKYLAGVVPAGGRFVPSLLGAVLFWDFFTRVMQGVTMTFFEDVWSRNFLNVFSTPITTPEYLAGLVVSSVGSSLIGLIVMGLVAGAFGFSLLVYGIAAAPFILVLFLFGIALGIAACAMVLRMGPAAEWFVWPIPALLSPFAAVFYPVSTLPAGMRAVAWALPPSYVFEGLRAVAARSPVPWGFLAIGTVLALVYIMGAYWFYSATFRMTLKTGLIARYSAETVA